MSPVYNWELRKLVNRLLSLPSPPKKKKNGHAPEPPNTRRDTLQAGQGYARILVANFIGVLYLVLGFYSDFYWNKFTRKLKVVLV